MEEETNTEAVKVIRHVREGEHGKTARFEFPDNQIVFDILAAAYPREKEYDFYAFDNVLVADNYSIEVDKFLVVEAEKIGYILHIENRRSQDTE